MIIHDVEQGTEEWHKARIGIPTASEFDKIITPGGDPSKSWETYANRILAEEIVGHPIESFKSVHMVEGNDREAESVAYYEFQRSVTTKTIGFVTDDARTMGCSPDRTIGTDGLLETKNPLASTQVGYLIDGKLDKQHWPQLQGCLLITERQWIDIVSYVPEMPELIIRVTRDGPYIEAMLRELRNFNAKLQAKRQKLINGGYLKGNVAAAPPPAPPPKDQWTVQVDVLVDGLKLLKSKIELNAFCKARSEEINKVTLGAPTVERTRLADAINAAKAVVEDPGRNIYAG